jgi:hypothetical protein
MKKLGLPLAIAAVLAFAMPTYANAATGITEGFLVATGKTIDFHNIGNVTITSPKTGNITCTSMLLKAQLTTNSASTVAGTGITGSTASGCTVGGVGTANFTSLSFKSFHTTGGGTGTASMEAGVELSPGGVTCKYSMTSGSGTYNASETSEGGGKLTFSEQILSVSPAACGTSAKIDGTFKLTTDDVLSTPVHLM